MINYLKDLQGTFLALILLFFCLNSSISYAQDIPEWITKSNQYTGKLLEVIAKNNPESAARLGVDGFDDKISDLSEGFNERALVDLDEVNQYFKSELASTEDDLIKQDLLILIESTANEIEEIQLTEANLLPYYNATSRIYNGIRGLLEDRIPAERRQAALVRLKKYVGSEKGYVPLTNLGARRNAKGMEQKQEQNCSL